MNKCLIILNQQPLIPPFMLSAITCAKDRYDNVYYVNTKQPNNKSIFSHCANVHFQAPNSLESLVAIFKAFFSLFSAKIFKDIKKCINEKGFSFHIIKLFLIEQSVHHRLYPMANGIIKDRKNNSQITVFSTWFDACAYTAATLKKRNPSLKAVSLAHSYEILLIRNPYVPYRHVEYKHHYLDGVFFISHIIRDMYIEGVGPLKDEYMNKTHVCHLGSYKDHPNLNQNETGVFNICTCSRMIPLKRLDILMNALVGWNDGKVRWTHLGDGPMFDELLQKATTINNDNPLVDIKFLGRVPNSQVKEYYATKPVDLFVNLSEIEGLPISIMEAISYGIPVIATNVGGTSEVVDREIGFLIDKEIDPVLVKEVICKFKNLSEDRRNTMRQNAYDYWKSNFDAESNLTVLFDTIATI